MKTAPTELTEYLREYIPYVLDAFRIPGVSIAIVKDGEVIFNDGFGYRDVEKQIPVDSETLFAIGSTSKAVTAVLLGTLVDEGKLGWNDLVIDILPAFRLKDPIATQQMTIKDLLTHRCGLPRHDMVWLQSDNGRQELFERLRYLDPFASFRQEFHYNNLMYMVAGLVVEQLTGLSYEENVAARILEPLGMNNANCSVEDSQKSANFAYPYAVLDEKIERIPFRNIDAIAPAGAINAHMDDYVKWLMLNLNGGELNGKRVVSADSLREIHAPQMVIPASNELVAELVPFDEIGAMTYTLGWLEFPYRGHHSLQHAGGIDGFSAYLAFLPAEQIGVAILTNLQGTYAHYGITFDILDRLLGLEPRPWLERIRIGEEMGKAAEEETLQQIMAAQVKGTTPSHPLAAYGGVYEHPAYGRFTIHAQNDNLTGDYNETAVTLDHFHYDVFLANLDLKIPVTAPISFSSDLMGNVNRVFIQLEEKVADIEFKRVEEEQ